jgi:hypothetical protein
MFVMVLGLAAVSLPTATAAAPGGNNSAAKACQQGGYASLVRSDGSRFANVGECVSYAAHGGIFDRDDDFDGAPDSRDNCPGLANPDQADTDQDGQGDACDATPSGDGDGDGVDNGIDNCLDVANPDQSDGDGDGIGDACDVPPSISVAYTSAGSPFCIPNVTVTGFAPNTTYVVSNLIYYRPPSAGSAPNEIYPGSVTTDGQGNAFFTPFSYRDSNNNSYEAVIDGVSSGASVINC